MAARPVSPRRALEEQLRTVSAQLSESLASLGVMDGQEYLTTAPLEPALVPDGQAPVPDSTAALLDRIRELEVQTQTLQQQATQRQRWVLVMRTCCTRRFRPRHLPAGTSRRRLLRS